MNVDFDDQYQKIKEADKIIIELKYSISTNEIERKIDDLDEQVAKLILKRIFTVCWTF